VLKTSNEKGFSAIDLFLPVEKNPAYMQRGGKEREGEGTRKQKAGRKKEDGGWRMDKAGRCRFKDLGRNKLSIWRKGLGRNKLSILAPRILAGGGWLHTATEIYVPK